MSEAPSDAVQPEGAEEPAPVEAPETAQEAQGPPPQYWLRVHGYVSDLSAELVSYGDFYDLVSGRLPPDPPSNLRVGDVIIYYADGPGSLYGSATVVGPVEGPLEGAGRGPRWTVPIKRDLLIKVVNKAPHAVPLEPPSGRHFLPLVRDWTYIRLPEPDGVYLLSQVKARASTRE